MKIYTRQGDKGHTRLANGQHVSKDSALIEAYGTIDELNSWIGVLIDNIPINETFDECIWNLNKIQYNLFTISSHLHKPEQSNDKLPSLSTVNVKVLEVWIDNMTKQLPIQKHFILPRGVKGVSYCHLARTVCRRAERRVVTIQADDNLFLPIMKYINRLSDALYILARYVAKQNHIDEKYWIPDKL